jgi:hypothetical protein
MEVTVVQPKERGAQDRHFGRPLERTVPLYKARCMVVLDEIPDAGWPIKRDSGARLDTWMKKALQARLLGT